MAHETGFPPYCFSLNRTKWWGHVWNKRKKRRERKLDAKKALCHTLHHFNARFGVHPKFVPTATFAAFLTHLGLSWRTLTLQVQRRPSISSEIVLITRELSELQSLKVGKMFGPLATILGNFLAICSTEAPGGVHEEVWRGNRPQTNRAMNTCLPRSDLTSRFLRKLRL